MRHTHGLPFPHETDSRRSAPGDATAPRSSRRGATDISLSFCTDFFVLRPPHYTGRWYRFETPGRHAPAAGSHRRSKAKRNQRPFESHFLSAVCVAPAFYDCLPPLASKGGDGCVDLSGDRGGGAR